MTKFLKVYCFNKDACDVLVDFPLFLSEKKPNNNKITHEINLFIHVTIFIN